MNDFSQTRLDRLHRAMRRHVDSGYTPGLVTLVQHRSRKHVDVMGTMAFNSTVPMRRDTIFRLASMTKPITAVGAMILVEECRIRLDDPVDERLPELKDRKVLRTIESPLVDTVPAKRPITLRDLLTFRAGYGEVSFLSPTCPLQKAMMEARLPLTEWLFAGTPDEFMKRLGNLPLAHQPGDRWLYHMGCEILGVLIARVSGQSLGSFLRERIFEPLGMKDTGFFVPEAKLDRLPTCYGTDLFTGQLVVLDEARGGQVARPPVFEAGAGGLVSTIDDMAVLGQMMLNKGAYGHERILSRPSIDLMTNGRQVVYVGRSTDQPLGIRLRQHTIDRLNGRWNRFSWFGVFPVGESGALSTNAVGAYDLDALITTMEAILIEGLEPPQNRKRGDEFKAVEFLQVEDPEIQKSHIVQLMDRLKEKL